MIGFPNKLEVIGSKFLLDCTSFDKSIDLPLSIKTIGGRFMCGLNAMKSSVNVHHMEVVEVFKAAKNSFALDIESTNQIIIKTSSENVSKEFRNYFPKDYTTDSKYVYRDLKFNPEPTQK